MTKEKVLKALSDISADIEQGFGLRAKRKIFDLFVGLSFTPFPSRWISVDEKPSSSDSGLEVQTAPTVCRVLPDGRLNALFLHT